jgi:glycosyltransferase involved in cell wall biosynthesis
MRFLMLNWRDPSNPISGGAERVSLAYMSGLISRGHEVFWFANDFPGAPPEETIDGVKILRGGGKGGSVLKAREWYRQQPRFNLVIDQQHGIPWYAPWWAKTNCIAYLHEILGPIWKSFYRWPLSIIGQWQEQFTYRLYRNVQYWTCSESTKRALHQAGVHQVKVINNGLELEPLAELEPKPLRAPLRLITVARLAPNKRIDHAIEAARILNKKGVEASLTVVGGGGVEDYLRQLASQNGAAGHITFAGRLSESDKNAHLRKAHLLLHTSVREGWGLNVVEANAMGTPAVVYPVAGLVDSTVHDRTGLVTPEETPESVAESIVGLLKSPEKYDQFRQNARDRAREFQWSRVLPAASDWLEEQARKGVTPPQR